MSEDGNIQGKLDKDKLDAQNPVAIHVVQNQSSLRSPVSVDGAPADSNMAVNKGLQDGDVRLTGVMAGSLKVANYVVANDGVFVKRRAG